MINELGDPYSVFYYPPETENFDQYLQGEFGGIGAEITEESGNVVIRSLLIDSPAEKAGLLPNDRIVEIDGENMIGQSATTIANQIRGDIDTQVTLTIERKEIKQTFTLTRDIINIGYTQAKRLDNAIYVDINLFTALSFIDFTQSIQEQIAKNPDFKGFIIDLRNNPGGYLESVKSIMGHFVPYGEPLLYIKTGPNTLESHLSQGKGEWEDYPVVILINQESASASEIMALTLLERNHISLVGETSYGKGTVQQVIDYQDGSSLKLTIAEWQSLNQTSINKVGIEPTIPVAFTSDDIESGRDPQLDAARAELKRLTRLF